jgi:hypothetical protein
MPTWELIIGGILIGTALIAACIYWAMRPILRGKQSQMPEPIDRRDTFESDPSFYGSATHHDAADHH